MGAICVIYKAVCKNESITGNYKKVIDWLKWVTDFEFDSEKYRALLKEEQCKENEKIIVNKTNNCYIKCFNEDVLINELEKEINDMKLALSNIKKDLKILQSINVKLFSVTEEYIQKTNNKLEIVKQSNYSYLEKLSSGED